MSIPVWVTYVAAALVIVFGLHRLNISRKSDEETTGARRGLYGMSRRAHRIIGLLYIALGGLLIATAAGFSPFGALFGSDTQAPAQDTAPIPIDQLPPKK